MGLGAGNLSLRLLFPPRRDGNNAIHPNAEADRSYNTPPPAAFRQSVLAVAIASSVALAAGGPPAALADVSRPLVAGALVTVLFVALCGGLWGCTRGAAGAADSARGAYGKVAANDREAHEVELKPFVGDDETDDDGGGGSRGDGDYLDEEDGYLADEGETERSGSGRRGGAGAGTGAGGGRRVNFSTLPPANRSSSSPPPRGGGGGAPEAPGSMSGAAAATGAAGAKKARPKAAPPAKSLFSVGHTVEL